MDDDPVAQFMAITDQSAAVASGCLAMTEGDVMAAVNMFFENPDIANSFPQSSSATAPSSSSRPQGASSSSRNIGREDASGVIHIDDDDDGTRAFDQDGGLAEAERIAQENDDAAMARRIQEEMYGEGAVTTDGVRAPIARTTETLVAPSGYGGVEDDYDMLEQLRRRNRPRPSGNPFGQSIWEDTENSPAPPSFASAAGGSSQPTRAQRLADLFRPPYELMDNMTWDEARTLGKEEKKWILVNVQDMNDFNCQALNRDIWKDEPIVALVKENFIFLQYATDDPRATEYNTFYFNQQAQENKENFPHVSIIDPRTGEQVKVWSGLPFPQAQEFHAQLVEFLDRYSLAQNSKNPVSKQKRPQRAVDVDRMTEEEMLEMAMRNSLETNGNGDSSASVSVSASALNAVQDPDELTKSLELEKGKGKAAALDEVMGGTPDAEAEADAALSAQSAAFASIAADKPHTEPAHDPATTTRIQFRHPEGRTIRRFAVSDPVRRIYEWLKAEPITEDRAGQEFELKVVPPTRDLIDDLDKTIAEAGVKQATVMIEFVEP
ncbi:UBX domain-containing protein 5 [Cytospora mali]|uniref:UBX domain-containing protein 5 n=1 Tax=Cytospora mali TaxID=578113 RepID=A0A194V2G2_CYTMA|nr:UBX domain-containing protein 5 [Valsa mali var. pyri (nom. inval.)]